MITQPTLFPIDEIDTESSYVPIKDLKIELYHGDCLEVMKDIPDGSIDMVCADPPYGTTACKWDSVIPLEPMWEQLKRVIKKNGAIVLFGSQPFTTILIQSNLGMFHYELIWLKTRPSNVFNAKKMFMKWHENVVVFYKQLPTYNPIMNEGKSYSKTHYLQKRDMGIYGKTGEKDGHVSENNGLMCPKTVIEINNPNYNSLHPTQKPVALMEYLIKTYTNEGDTVLDFCMGSGTTGVACVKIGNNFIGIESDEKYFNIARQRINNT